MKDQEMIMQWKHFVMKKIYPNVVWHLKKLSLLLLIVHAVEIMANRQNFSISYMEEKSDFLERNMQMNL